jgi:sugar phosphate isomerase/epimerase
MILTLETTALLRQWSRNGSSSQTLLDLPGYAMKTLGLRGLNIPASALAGWGLRDCDSLRDQADKAGCPCLVLVEDSPLELASEDPGTLDEAIGRVRRLAAAANRLGCNSLALRVAASDDDESFERSARTIRRMLGSVERLELNLLLAPHDGLTDDPDRLAELIKRIGGFRIGSLPSFGHASQRGDVIGVLRRLAPYAGAIHATVHDFTKAGKHKEYDLAKCVQAIRSVGFTNTLAIEYVGTHDPVPAIEKARDVLNKAIDTESGAAD